MQLANNGKIYLNRNVISLTNNYLGVINNPNNLSTPNYVENGVFLGSNSSSQQESLTTFIDAEQSVIPTDLTATTDDCKSVEFSAPCWEGYNFNWDFGDGNTSSLENPTHTYASPGTYNVTATVTLGSVTQTLTGTATAISQNCLNINCELTTNQIITNGNSGSITINNGDVVEINGTYTINNSPTYTNVKFKMATGAQVIINNGQTLTLDGCHLFSCSELWNEITVGNGANLVVDNYTVIEDANKAINWIDGGSVTVNKTLFNKNSTGINLQGTSGSAPNVQVQNSIFTCRNMPNSFYQNPATTTSFASLKNILYNNTSFIYQYGDLLAPAAPNTRSKYGVRSTKTDVTIGVAGSTTNRNLFDYLDYGVYVSKNSNLNVYNNMFSNLSGNNNSGLKGVGVYAITKNLNILNVGGLNTQDGNLFNNCYRGIYTVGFSKMNILNNSLINNFTSQDFTAPIPLIGHYGIYIQHNNFIHPDYLYQIKSNNISNFETGIFINQSFSNNNDNNITIAQNTIQGSPNDLTSSYCNRGVWIQHNSGSGQSGPSLLSIKENTIKHCEYNALLFENILKELSVTNNYELSVNYNTYNSKQVVRFNSCAEFEIINNNVITTTNNTTIPTANSLTNFITGIYLQNCQTSTVKCNNIEYVDDCVRFDQPSDHSSFYNNTMNKAQYGLIVANGAILGPQGDVNEPSGNEWGAYNSTNITQAHTYVHNTANVNTNSPLYCTPNSNTNCTVGVKTLPCENTGSLFGFEYSTPIGLSVTTGPNPDCLGVIGSPIVNTTRRLVNEAKSASDEKVSYLQYKRAYQLIDNDESGELLQEKDLAKFYHKNKTKNIGKMAKIERFIAQQHYVPAKAHINNFVPQNEIEANYKAVYSIYIQQLIDATDSLTPPEINTLTNIANTCISKGGKPTIIARSMIALYSKNAVCYNDCEEEYINENYRLANPINENTNTRTKELITVPNFSIYPNPNTGNFTLTSNYIVEKNISVKITDVSGKIVYNSKMNTSTKQIDLRHVNKGMYFVSLSNPLGEILSIDKISIE